MASVVCVFANFDLGERSPGHFASEHPDLGEEGIPWESRFHRDMTDHLAFLPPMPQVPHIPGLARVRSYRQELMAKP